MFIHNFAFLSFLLFRLLYSLCCVLCVNMLLGVLTNTQAVSALLHRYNALSFFDFAGAAPYCEACQTGREERTEQEIEAQTAS